MEDMDTEVLFPATAVLCVAPLLQLRIGAPLVNEKYLWTRMQGKECSNYLVCNEILFCGMHKLK